MSKKKGKCQKRNKEKENRNNIEVNNRLTELNEINDGEIEESLLSKPGRDRINYLEELVSKQLNLYNWCEEKVSTLATMDSILLAAATIVVEQIMVVGKDATYLNKILNISMIFFVLLPVLISLAISLWYIRPKMGKQSNTGIPSHRSSNGIRHFKDWEEYQKRLYSISDEEICQDFIKQIYGMNKNIWKNQISIKIAVGFDLFGLLGFLGIMIVWVII